MKRDLKLHIVSSQLLFPLSSSRVYLLVPYNPGPHAHIFQHEHSIYVGKPSSELDKAWKKMLKSNLFLLLSTYLLANML
jgi:hypothetical protein